MHAFSCENNWGMLQAQVAHMKTHKSKWLVQWWFCKIQFIQIGIQKLPPQRHGLYKFVEFHMRHSVVCLCYSCSNHYVLKEKQATHYCMPFKTFCSSNFYFAKCKNSLKAKTTYYSSTLLQNPKKEQFRKV